MDRNGQTKSKVIDKRRRDAPQPVEKRYMGELKTLMLTIDWEITDEVMHRFIKQVDQLKTLPGERRAERMLLKILGVVGRYICKYKAKADPYAMTVLKSAYVTLDKTVASRKTGGVNTQVMLSKSIERFKKLKNRLSEPAPAAPRETEPVVAPEDAKAKPLATDAGRLAPSDPLGSAFEEIKHLIREELKMLRQEMQKNRVLRE